MCVHQDKLLFLVWWFNVYLWTLWGHISSFSSFLSFIKVVLGSIWHKPLVVWTSNSLQCLVSVCGSSFVSGLQWCVSHRGARVCAVCLLSLSVCHRYEALESAPLSEAERGAFAQIICGRRLFLLNKWRAEKVGTSGLVAAGYLWTRAMRSAEYCMPYRCRAESRVMHMLHKELISALLPSTIFPSPPVNSVYPYACSLNTRTASAWVLFLLLSAIKQSH